MAQRTRPWPHLIAGKYQNKDLNPCFLALDSPQITWELPSLLRREFTQPIPHLGRGQFMQCIVQAVSNT